MVVGVKKKAKPSPKKGTLLSLVKKAKLHPKVRKLLAKANSAIKQSLEGDLFDHQKDAVEKGKLVGFKASDFIFQQPYIPVYTTPPITGGPPPFPLADMDPIVTAQDIADWMLSVAEIIFDFIHWQPITKEVLLEVRKYIEEGYDEDFIPKIPVSVGAPEKFPKEGLVHRVIVRLRRLFLKEHGQFSDEVNALFAAVFPPPELPVIAAWAKFEPLIGTSSGPNPPTFVKTQEEAEAVFGKPDMMNEQAKYTALMMEGLAEYLKAHPAPEAVVQPNTNNRLYSAEIWDAAVKKLQPKFSVEAAKDAKAQGLGQIAEDIMVDSLSPGIMPVEHIEVNFVLDKDKVPLLETAMGGKVVGMTPVQLTGQHLTSKGLATLDRFGAVLKGT